MPRKAEYHVCEGNRIGQATTDHCLTTLTGDLLAAVARRKPLLLASVLALPRVSLWVVLV